MILAASPNAYWRLGETTGTATVSEVNNGTMQLTYQTGYTLGIAGAIAGDPDKAVSFTAGATSGSAHQTLQDVGDVFTWESWLKRATFGVANMTPYTNGDGSSSFCLRFDADNTLRLDKEGVSTLVNSTVAISNTLWHHCVATKNGATVKIYIDGVDVTGVVTNATMGNPTSYVQIGADTGGVNGFNGTIDEVALYPTALSAATVLSHYQIGTNPDVVKSFRAIPFTSRR